MKFTSADFISAAHNTCTTAESFIRMEHQEFRAHPKIPSSKIRLPVPPPSPLFAGINEDINMEPFPDLQISDLDTLEETEPLHCIIHCQEDICQRMVYHERAVPPCRCELEAPMMAQNTSSPQSEHDAEDSVVEDQLLTLLKSHITDRASNTKELAGQSEIQVSGKSTTIALIVSDVLFGAIYDYFESTLRQVEYRVLSIRMLRLELNNYVQAMYLSSDSTPDVVLTFLDLCINSVIGLMIWRDKQKWVVGED
ncbi:hypothetical protein BKA66DRAFT_468044 [Pyrenochaeta sp. MPI-SDFR-AT-0127]|nr:hypothetical protein BKA66DRAFT_468044 [Pyrenochaeta sp. MPI-SDFR-AT-0127]